MNTAVNALPPGTRLGQYRLDEPASHGGFGILYRAWDEKMNRPVAVKECFPASICHRNEQTGEVQPHTEPLRPRYETALSDVYEEAQMLAGLHHARVVPVYDIFRAAGSLFYVMPWLEGGSLRDKIAAAAESGQGVPQEWAVRWLLELLPALEYLHGKQITHRDIKPGNIMFDADGNPVLVDFGSALNRATKVDTTTQGEFSPVYASPEQVSGKGKIGPWTDLYSLAATWYALLTGTPPEPAQQRLLKDDLAPLAKGATVLEQSIMQNLALAAGSRCQSAQEWLDWLQKGVSPVAVVRRRRSALLWAVPALAVGAVGVFYLGCSMGGLEKVEQPVSVSAVQQPEQATPAAASEAAPAGSVSQASSDFPSLLSSQLINIEVSDEFYKVVCEAIELDKMNEAAQKLIDAASKRTDEYYQRSDSILSEMRLLAIEGSKTRAQREKLYAELKTEQEQCNEWLFGEFHKASSNLVVEILKRVSAPEDFYPWKTQEEFLILQKLKPRLEADFKPNADALEQFHQGVGTDDLNEALELLSGE